MELIDVLEHDSQWGFHEGFENEEWLFEDTEVPERCPRGIVRKGIMLYSLLSLIYMLFILIEMYG